MKKGRRPRRDELDLWNQVARTAHKMPGRPETAPSRSPTPTRRGGASEEPERTPTDIPSTFGVGARAPARNSVALPQSTSDRLARSRVDMDAKSYGRMKRGKLVPEARIDLHGMTLDEAHPALVGFILSSHTRGLRLVLVITGKGQREDPYDPMPRRRGVLKSQVPQWLKMPPLGPVVLQVTEAHIRHGGQGALYVYLRRRR
ncbi:Smr/MutS family protein [Roseivivax marinus]|uniref:Smr/MutS family protein n=1 Tax=Roseivivax marinus TaxID=1379903 RepID=UPI00273E46E7|nr:Smr/MutS family protein [Roseivivax marinus]